MKYIAQAIYLTALLAFIAVMSIFISKWFLFLLLYLPFHSSFDDKERHFPKSLNRKCKEDAVKAYCESVEKSDHFSRMGKAILKMNALKDIRKCRRNLPKDYAEKLIM